MMISNGNQCEFLLAVNPMKSIAAIKKNILIIHK